MRGNNTSGRFSLRFEANSIHEAIQEDVETVVNQSVEWWAFNPDDSNMDDVYDVSGAPNPILDPDHSGFGRKWRAPRRIPVVQATLIQGESYMNPRGFYTSDVLHLTINAKVAYETFPTLLTDPNIHLKDRLGWRGELFVPTKVWPRGELDRMFTTITIDATQVNTEETVNDPQLKDEKLTDGVWHDNYMHLS